jgi:hypothetical protein
MSLKRMDNVGIVVESLDAAISFFAELGLKLEGASHDRRGVGWSAKWFSTRRRIGSATSAARKDFSSGSPRSSGPVPPRRRG